MTAEAIEWGDGDVRARVAACYDRSVHDIYRYLHRATAGDRRLTEDLTQETFMACVRAVRDGVPDATTLPWLMGVARHKLIDHYRRRSRDERKLSLAWSVRDDETSSFVEVTDTQALDALARLAPLHRIVLVLRYVDDLLVSDVAAAIDRSVRATESLIVRARHALELSLQEVSDV
jgi:RNA polymerase sigma-70 factor, ECF subfamily